MAILVLSDTANLNHKLASALAYEIKKRGEKVAYVSSSLQKIPRIWFKNTVEEYNKIDPNINIEYFDLSDEYCNNNLKDLLQFGTIHLSGGNAFEFLSLVKKRNFQDILKQHLMNAGLVIGVSAGAIVLTPSIKTASISGDENSAHLQDYTGLKYLPFEFYPHFSNSKEEIDKLTHYSKNTENLILACKDGDGILFENNHMKCIGNVLKIHGGKRSISSSMNFQ